MHRAAILKYMTTHLSTTGSSSELQAWNELEEVFVLLGELARSPVEAPEFYRRLLAECVRALSAAGGVIWLRLGGSLQPTAQIRWPGSEWARNDEFRQAHEQLLADATSRGQVTTVTRQLGQQEAIATPTDQLLLGPVSARSDVSRDAAPPLAIIELLIDPNTSPAAMRGMEQFLTAVCELAADYHAFAELRRLRHDDEHRAQLLRLSCHVHRQLDLREAAYAVANEGRQLIGCDRLSVVAARGTDLRLLATSGVSRVERRSCAVRRIEQLAQLVRNTSEPAFYDDGQCDGLPPVAEALEQHAEESHARQIAAVPLGNPLHSQADRGNDSATAQGARRHEHPLFVLVAEQFDASHGNLPRDRLAEVAAVCATALYNAEQVARLPLGWLMRPLGEASYWVGTHLSRAALALAAITACLAALALIPADFRIESPGTLQPVAQRDVFAPRDGLVDEVLVAHGAQVAAGQPLVRLRDPALDLELKRVDGELETTQRQLDAVRATRTNRQVRDANPADAYRLSAEERELQQRLTNLRHELDLLNRGREALVVASPIAGRMLSWDIGHRLIARPVERGEVLATVADLSADWQLELEVPDDRIGYVLAAQQAIRPDLPVRFRLSSDDREQHTGHIVEVSQTAAINASESEPAPAPTVLVKVALDDLQLSDDSRRELRPGVSARAQIDCGRRSLGYVWLHDIWDAALEWLRF
jgi:multidrug efflux pump subunit AcrA (membrane-fusion protein)